MVADSGREMGVGQEEQDGKSEQGQEEDDRAVAPGSRQGREKEEPQADQAVEHTKMRVAVICTREFPCKKDG